MKPGLDRAALLALRRAHRTHDHIPDRITAHLQAHDGYLAFSGGKDSLVVLHQTLAVEPNIPVVFFDSGLEFPETLDYIHQLAETWHLNLHVYRPTRNALQLLIDSGAWDHHAPTQPVNLQRTLITEPAAAAHADHGDGELWGVRAQESRGRAMRYARALTDATARDCSGCCTGPRSQTLRRQRHGGTITRRDGTCAYGPIWDWRTEDVWAHIARHRIPTNPLYTRLRSLGAPEHFQRVSLLLDGNRIHQGRATFLRRGWPTLFDELTTALPRLREFI